MAARLFIVMLLHQVLEHTAKPAPGLLFNKFFPPAPPSATAPMLPLVGIINGLAGVIPSVLSPGVPQVPQAPVTPPGQSPGASPVFPIPGITAPLFPGIFPSQPSVPAPPPGSTPASGTSVPAPGTSPGSTTPGFLSAITAPLLPGISAVLSSMQAPLTPPATYTTNGTSVSPTTLTTDQLKSQLDAAKITYIQNGLAYGIALAQQVITGFLQGLLNPMTTTTDIQNG